MGPLDTIKQNDSTSPNGLPRARYYTQEELDHEAQLQAQVLELMIFSPKLKITVTSPVRNGYYDIEAKRVIGT
jgi:hypothetical protein